MKNLIVLLFVILHQQVSAFQKQKPQQLYIYQKCTQLSFLPMPKKIKCNLDEQITFFVHPCNIKYYLKAQVDLAEVDHIRQLIAAQQYKTFRCRSYSFKKARNLESLIVNEYAVEIYLSNAATILTSAFQKQQQKYSLVITKQKAIIKANHYVGFVRGLQTFLQSIIYDKKLQKSYMIALPIQIQDQPQFQYRGLLVDSSRHFLPMFLLKQTIDAMMYNKLNILHWHIVDEDSFPLELKSHPQLAQHGAFSVQERYSIQQVKQLIRYAMIRGVRIIPQIDTPGHSAIWAKAPQNSDIACLNSKSKYKGPLDVTLAKTYEIVKQVFKEIFQLFPDPYIHLGGDQVQLKCLTNKTNFVKLEGIQQKDIQLHYRRKQKKMLKQLNASKTFIYWITDKIIDVQPDDIVHWWGQKHLLPPVQKSKIIISTYKKQLYIDMGFGNIFGKQYHDYGTWLDIYNLNIGKEIIKQQNSNNVIGGVVTLWSEMSNLYTHHTRIWIRSSSFAQRIWTSYQYSAKPDFLRRIAAHERLMNKRGIPTSPATCQQCQYHPQFC